MLDCFRYANKYFKITGIKLLLTGTYALTHITFQVKNFGTNMVLMLSI